MDSAVQRFPLTIRLLHLGLILFGIGSYLTGEMADIEDSGSRSGYLLHAYLGLSLLVFLLGRLGYGFAGPAEASFRQWNPFTRAQLRAVREDFLTLLRFRLPQRELHVGLAGLVQGFGFAIFLWMAQTGTLIFALGGTDASGFARELGELHEEGDILILVFLAMHVGAVVLHELSGHRIWKRISPFHHGE